MPAQTPTILQLHAVPRSALPSSQALGQVGVHPSPLVRDPGKVKVPKRTPLAAGIPPSTPLPTPPHGKKRGVSAATRTMARNPLPVGAKLDNWTTGQLDNWTTDQRDNLTTGQLDNLLVLIPFPFLPDPPCYPCVLLPLLLLPLPLRLLPRVPLFPLALLSVCLLLRLVRRPAIKMPCCGTAPPAAALPAHASCRRDCVSPRRSLNTRGAS